MIWIWFALLVAATVVTGSAGRRLGRQVFLVGAAVHAAIAVWALYLAVDESTATASATWVAGLDLGFDFRVGALGALMTLVVAGIGVCVFAYASGYFGAANRGTTRLATTLLAFSAAMLGLVWADSVWTLFVFWELTTVTSFLLVGHDTTDAGARLAARRALLITAGGGLALLGGFVVLVDETGTPLFSEMSPVDGTTATVAALLVLVGAATKSAQVPFHVWLPGAMAAPTPVSTYLHAATMVKAGVLLVALANPVLDGIPSWRTLTIVVGLASVLWGGIGALRQRDAKLILAWGTVSQLGLMIALLGVGTAKATFAALAVLAAHAVFKAALFMVVGEVDVRTGTRDIDELDGLWAAMPLTGVVALVAAASMAGIPPTLGFPAKEAAIEAVVGLSGTERWLIGAAVVAGSVLTVAYTVRLLLGLFAGSPERAPAVAPARPALTGPLVLLGALTVVGFVAADAVGDVVARAAGQLDPAAAAFTLLRWPGVTTALWISLGVIAVGLVLGYRLSERRIPVAPARGAERADRAVDDVLRGARLVAGRVQHGSLPVYLSTMAAVAALTTLPFLADLGDADLRWADSGLQAVAALLVAATAIAVSRLTSRLGAALGLGAVGLGVSALFLVHGAPDLALTQLLVETVVVVGFVIALGQLTRRFPATGAVWHRVRLTIAALTGVAVTVALVAAGSTPTGEPPVEALAREARDTGGGNNVVNVILTDIRAVDTLGEVLVLLVVGVGIMALARTRRPADDRAVPEAAGSRPS